MSVESDTLAYAHSMLQMAFDRLYSKQDNHFEHKASHLGLAITADSFSGDDSRVIKIVFEVPKHLPVPK